MDNEKTSMESFFENQVCLVVEPSKAFLAALLACLKSLNLPSTQILSASQFEAARAMIETHKPRVLITEYEVDGHNGLELVELQQRHHEDQHRISMVVSKNSSDSVIAEAAEEQVDTFLLKPFSPDDFVKKINEVIRNKVHPSAYVVKINEGRKFMHTQEFENAVDAFSKAKSLHAKPALACFYSGETFRLQKDSSKALAEFQAGRKFQPLHYKCLTAEFEILVENKDYKEAYELIPVLIKNFPLTPRRLTQVFIAAVYSLRFEYLSVYYDQLIKLDKKSPELIKVATAALFAGGKWFLQKREMAQASELFEKALLTMGRDISFLTKIIAELLKSEACREAEAFFQMALPSDVGSSDYNRLAFRIDSVTLNRGELVERARKFFLSGEAEVEDYKTIIKLFVEQNRMQLAEAAINKAIESYPQARSILYRILEGHSPAGPKS